MFSAIDCKDAPMNPNQKLSALIEAANGLDSEDFEQKVQLAATDFHTLDRDKYVRSLPRDKQAKIIALAKKIGDLAGEILEIAGK